MHISERYNAVANKYDTFYSDILCNFENGYIATELSSHVRDYFVEDIGCGTGLLLDMLHTVIKPDMYRGTDIAPAMVEMAKNKYPEYSFEAIKAEDIEIYKDRLYVALFGSPSYFDLDFLMLLKHSGAKYYLMFCRKGYGSRVLGDNAHIFTESYSQYFDGHKEFSLYDICTNL